MKDMITSEAKGAGRCVAELPGGRGQKRNGTGAAWPLCLIQELGTDVSFSLAPTAGGFTEGTTGSGCLVIWRTARKPSRVPS